jgi:hypothetical protein
MRQNTGRTGIIATEVVGVHLTVTAAARLFGLSRQHVYRLLKRFREAARRPSTHAHATPPSNPHTITDEVTVAIVGLRERLTADGLDAGPRTLQWHLAQQGLTPSDASGPAAPTSASRPPNTAEC